MIYTCKPGFRYENGGISRSFVCKKHNGDRIWHLRITDCVKGQYLLSNWNNCYIWTIFASIYLKSHWFKCQFESQPWLLLITHLATQPLVNSATDPSNRGLCHRILEHQIELLQLNMTCQQHSIRVHFIDCKVELPPLYSCSVIYLLTYSLIQFHIQWSLTFAYGTTFFYVVAIIYSDLMTSYLITSATWFQLW